MKGATTATLLQREDLPPGVDLAQAQREMDHTMELYVKFEIPKIFSFLAEFGAAKERDLAVKASESSSR